MTGRASIALDRNWTLSGQTRRDIEQREFVEVGGGLAYVNECCEIDLFVKKRFTESEDAPKSTSVGVQVRLFSLGDGIIQSGLALNSDLKTQLQNSIF